jgi:mannose-1-phosphate guanylyltransferase
VKAYLLAGGLGTRLGAETQRLPKCLIDINGIPLLAIWLDLCARHGVDDILVNVSHHADAVRRYLQAVPAAVRVTLVEEATPLGSAGTVLANRAFVGGESSFFVLYADNLTRVDLTRARAFHETHEGVLTMGVFQAPRPEQAGIVRLGHAGRVEAYEEKPRHPSSPLANAGMYLARPALFDAIPTRPGVVDFGYDVLPALVGRMFGYEISEYLADIGTPQGLTAARAAWRRRNAAGAAR